MKAYVFASVWVLLVCSINATKLTTFRGNKCTQGGKPTCGHYNSCTQTQCQNLLTSNGESCAVWKTANMKTWKCFTPKLGLTGGGLVRQQDGGVRNTGGDGKTYYLHVQNCHVLKSIWSEEGDARLCHDARVGGNHNQKCESLENVNTGELICGRPTSSCHLFQRVSDPTKQICYNEEGQHFCAVLLNHESGVHQCGADTSGG